MPGGALDPDESPLTGALREAAEEAAVPASSVRPRHAWTVDHGTWAYTTVVAEAVGAIVPQRLDGESEELRWVPTTAVTSLPLHSGFAAAWSQVSDLVRRRETVVIDAANVVGSVPDGWWRDRAGAASRLLRSVRAWDADGVEPSGLLDEVVGRTRAWPDWVVVLEGAARAAADPPDQQPTEKPGERSVSVVRADGSGDDAIVEVTRGLVAGGGYVTVVTADRELRSRVAAIGARCVGPGVLPRR